MKENPLKKGSYSLLMYLPLGSYEYRFYSDGEWFDSPKAEKTPNSFGMVTHVVSVS